METALELSFCCFLNFPYLYKIKDVSGIFEGLDYFMTILIGCMILCFPFWAAIFYNKNYDYMGDEKFESKYGAVYEGLRTEERWSIANGIIFMVRRVILAATCIYLYEYIFL
jgi:hypothetical protein